MSDQTVQFKLGFLDFRRWIRLFWNGSFAFIILVFTTLLFVANLYYGELNQDEGWYLYAGRLILEGQVPYRDFAFTQGPVMAYVYALAQPLVKTWGVAGGRLFTGLIGLVSALGAAVLAARLVGTRFWSGAALIAFILIMVNVYQSYYFIVVKTYSLCAFFLVFGFLFLREALELRSRAAVFLAGMAFVLATATRSSAGIVLPVIFCFLALDRQTPFRSACVFFALGAAFMAALVFGPFLLLTPDNFLFMVLRYHTLRESGGFGARLLFKAGFISRLVQAYLPAMTIGATLMIFHLFNLNRIRNRKAIAPPPNGARLSRMLWGSVIAVSLVHLLAPFPYEDYQVMIYPLFAVALAAAVMRQLPTGSFTWKVGTVFCVLVLCALAAGSSPMNQEWFIQGRDRIWWRTKDKAPLEKLRLVGRELKAMAPLGNLLLTQDPYLAVESGLKLPPGLELGQFSYFPDLSSEQAAKFHVLNRASMRDLLETCPAPVAALSGYAFAIRSPGITELPAGEQLAFRDIVQQRYRLVREIPHFGQAATTLRLYRLKSDKSQEDSGF